MLGVNRRGRLAKNLVELWLGITTDEIERAKDSRVAFITHKFPLLDFKFKRGDCEEYLKSRGLLIPKKSSCVFCPFKKISEWIDLKANDPNNFSVIADLEEHINNKNLVVIEGKPKHVSFVRAGSLIHADFLAGNQPRRIEADFSEMCDGGFCQC